MFKLRFTNTANKELDSIAKSLKSGLAKQIEKALEKLESNPRHPALHTHRFTSLHGPNGEEIWQSYAQNKTPGAYRVFWHYGPNEGEVHIITIVALTTHP